MLRAGSTSPDRTKVPFDIVVLRHDERHLRRKVITLQHGDTVLVDLPRALALDDRERLVLDDGRHVEVIAAEEELHEVRAADSAALMELAWHLGNRHTPAQIEQSRLLVQRDHVLADMLVGLGATVRDVVEPFSPVRGAYHRHADTHDHAGGHQQHAHHPADSTR